jgi:phosphate transport system permease protein
MQERADAELPGGRGGPDRAAAVMPYVRSKSTPRRVILVDRIADWTISIGGLAVILAVFAIMAFLVDVVLPLFAGPHTAESSRYALAPLPEGRGRPLALFSDEYETVGVLVDQSGSVEVFHLATGRRLTELELPLGEVPVTAFARTLADGHVVFGFADGSVRFGRIDARADVVPAEAVPAELSPLGDGDGSDGGAVYREVPGGQFRRVEAVVELAEPQPAPAAKAAIVALDLRVGGSVERPARAYVTVDAGGSAILHRSESRMNLLTRELTTTTSEVPLPALQGAGSVSAVLLTQLADEVFLAERDGTLVRFDVRDGSAPAVAETLDLVPGAAELTSLAFLIGEQSLVAGASDGSASVWFRVERGDSGTTDGRSMVLAHALAPQGAAITAIAPSQRSKVFATGDAGGDIWVRHATSEQVLLRLSGGLPGGVATAALSPRDEGVVALGSGRAAAHWRIAAPHPETTLGTIFGKVWYEGYPEPGYTWQSSSGTDLFEPKFSLVPLVFGTLKATVYSLIFAIPIALLAAIYTSEFVHPRVRTAVKPTMEMMASLPSVVLGFIAALVLAPWVETWIASVLLLFLAVPFSLLTGAYLWQLLPQPVALRLDGLPKLALMFAAVLGGTATAFALGPAFEALFFEGDLRHWLTGTSGSGTRFLGLLLLPLSFAVAAGLVSRGFGARLREGIRALDRTRAGLLDGGVWLATLGAALLLAGSAAALLGALGVDPRGGPIGSYVQRNTLVVGFAMGFAVIPIIYTIAEDAMSAVPAHLRAASLGCGATPWQTAVSVVIPTAMSGIFAGVMIGMGRAVGETMIVVMAAGNTPILDWNAFNGLRALSANIAVELPEAVKDGSLYRMLFLAALTLFSMTFVVNTLAELVRLRFRKRAAEL